MSGVILAVDQSTSATKGLLFDTEGKVLDKTSLPHEQFYPQPGWVEHDAEAIYQNTVQVIWKLISQNREAKENVLYLSITNQRETFVIFDRSTGKPLHKAIVWQCRRGEAICTELEAEGLGSKVQAITGLKIDTYFPASKIKWLLDNHPDLLTKLVSGEALLSTIDAYLIYRLTHHEVFASDHTNACRTLLYDINTLSWSKPLCSVFGIPMQALPKVYESSALFGETDLDGLLDQPIPICGVMGDSQAALFAEQCFTPGQAKVTFGTGSSVLLNIGADIMHSPNGIVTTIGWVYNGQPTYAFEGIINFTGATIAWMRDKMQYIETAAETEELATAVEDNGGVYLIPAFVGLSAPYWRANAKAAIIGLTPATTKNHIVRAALEAIAYRIKDVLGLMVQDAALDLQRVHADGGMVNNRFLMQFVADMTRYDVRASNLPELSALGAVMSGMLGMEVVPDLAALKKLPHRFADYSPTMPEHLAKTYYNGWLDALEQVLNS